MRENVTLQCGECKRRNYVTTKNKKKTTGKLQFVTEVVAELKKTSWPSRREVYGTTVVVIVTVMICALYLWVVDMMLNAGMDRVFRLFE